MERKVNAEQAIKTLVELWAFQNGVTCREVKHDEKTNINNTIFDTGI